VENVNVTLRRSVAVAALVITPLMTSCGFNNPTDRVYTPSVGVNDRSGQVDVLHALVVSGADGSGTVVAGLVNNDQEEADTLTRVAGAGEDQTIQVSLDGPVEVPARGSVQLVDETEISVEGEAVTSGAFVELAFTFERGETVTVDVPVVARRGDYAEVPVPSVAPTTATPEDEEHGAGH
jgi:hypothetical protein